jgi:predicted ATPase
MGRDEGGTLAALKAHRRELIDPKISEYGGRIVKTTGDGLLLEFPSVVNALRCAVDVQRGMRERNAAVAANSQIQFRIGINVGDIIIDGDDIYGDGVNVAARVQTLAEPAGICVSKVVRDQVVDKLSFAFENLGAQHLKNIARPLEVYRVREAPGSSATLSAPTFPGAEPFHGLSPGGRVLLGRDEDLRALQALISSCRLVTIVGSAGIGKTRLAEAAAHEQSDLHEGEVCWIDLSGVEDAFRLVSAVGARLDIALKPDRDARAQVIGSLRTRRLLLGLDNCEPVLDAVADFVGEAMEACPNVRWVLTSQQPLKLPDEQIYRLGPLAVPAPGTSAKEALGFGAVALLARQIAAADRRVAITDANVDVAIDLCAKLDGIPLAIEMAAARVPALGLDRVRALIGEHLHFLSARHRTPLARHQTLHAALDWSHSLLSPAEQMVLRRLGVFGGGFTIEAAQAVCAGTGPGAATGAVDEWGVIDAIEGLIAKSMVQTQPSTGTGEPRYWLLETTRLYALEQLAAAGEEREVRSLHARAMAAFAERAFADHWTQPDTACIARMRPEIDNWTKALDWAIAQSDAESAAEIVGCTWPLFRMLDRQYEAQAWMNAAEPLLRRATGLRAARGLAAVVYVFSHRVGPTNIAAAREAVERYRQLDDARGLYFALCGLAFAGSLYSEPGSADAQDAAAALAEFDRLERPDWPARLRCWGVIARTTAEHADPAARIKHLRAMYELACSVGATERALTAQSNMLGTLHALGRIDEFVDLSRRIVDDNVLAGERLGNVLLGLATTLAAQGSAEEARKYASEGLRVMQRCNEAFEAFAELASLALAERRDDDAARIAGYAESIRVREGIERASQARIASGIATELDARIGAARRTTLMSEGARLAGSQATALALRIAPAVGSGEAAVPKGNA